MLGKLITPPLMSASEGLIIVASSLLNPYGQKYCTIKLLDLPKKQPKGRERMVTILILFVFASLVQGKEGNKEHNMGKLFVVLPIIISHQEARGRQGLTLVRMLVAHLPAEDYHLQQQHKLKWSTTTKGNQL